MAQVVVIGLVCVLGIMFALREYFRKGVVLDSIYANYGGLRTLILDFCPERAQVAKFKPKLFSEVGWEYHWRELGDLSWSHCRRIRQFYAINWEDSPSLIPTSYYNEQDYGDAQSNSFVKESNGISVGQYLASLPTDVRRRISQIVLVTENPRSIFAWRKLVIFEMPEVATLNKWLEDAGFTVNQECEAIIVLRTLATHQPTT